MTIVVVFSLCVFVLNLKQEWLVSPDVFESYVEFSSNNDPTSFRQL